MNKNIYFERINIWKETQSLSNNYPEPEKSIKFNYQSDYHMGVIFDKTRIGIVNQDTIDCGFDLIKEGLNPLVINLADDCVPGGCVNYGSGAQEESLFRRTNYWKTLTMDLYPITEEQAIYSPQVCVFRASEQNNWNIYKKPKYLDFIACPGLKFPNTKSDMLENDDIKKLEHKIELILQVAHKTSHDSIVLGALGCGAWKNPPEHVAKIFRQVLEKNVGVFKKIVFAILTATDTTYINKMTRADNYHIFVNEFSKSLLKIY